MSDPWCGRRVAERFDILALLGKGAMGAVYRARDIIAGRDVALKVLLGHRLQERHRARFRREGEVTAALHHPGIVRVYSAGELPGDVPYLAYELVDGARTLTEACEADGVDLTRKVSWVRDAARALGAAHAQGVVHRDVKPDNLLVDVTGRLKVADFGMAWANGAERLTRTGTLVGTPYFMSPEQVSSDGQEAQPPCDVWALGVTLYWALTGSYPFDAPSLDELAFQIISAEPVPPHVTNPAVPRALSAVCLKCLGKEPQARYPDAGALAADLDRALAGEHVLARRRRVSANVKRRLLLAVAPTLAVLLLLAAIAHTPAPSPVATPEVAAVRTRSRSTTTTTSVATVATARVEAPPKPPPLIELVAAPAPPPGITFTAKGAWELAHNGLADAMKAVGGFYEKGKEGFPVDAAAAARWFEKGADLGDTDCMCELANLLLTNKGLEPDGPRAAALLERAVRGENVWAMRELGALYDRGAPGVPRDLARALDYYERFNRMNDAPVFTLLRAGELLRDGPTGVTRDEARAVACFERAHALENVAAARELALMLRDGRGAPKDEARAFTLLEGAVAADDVSSILPLGEMFATGTGVARDLDRARALFEEARRKRVPGADDALRALNGR